MEKIFKRINIVFLIAIIIISLYIVYSHIINSSLTIYNNQNEDLNIKKIHILVDPGHGGVDPGTTGDLNVSEAIVNLYISKKLMGFLEASGFEVEMTRYDENALYTEQSTTIRQKKNEDLKNRVALINDTNADLTVSIHLNAFTQKQYYGAHVFYKKNNESSKTAARTIQKNMKQILDKDNNRVPQAKKDIKIIDATNVPIVLVECGFLSNPQEEAKLLTDEYQEKVAWSIFAGILEYFNNQN